MDDGGRPSRGDEAGGGARRRRRAPARSRSSAPSRRSPAMVEEARKAGVAEIAAVGTAGLRIASNSGDVPGRGPGARRASRSRSSPARRRPASPTSRPRPRCSSAAGPRRLRHGRRQLAVHLRPRRTGRRALQRRRRRRPVHRAVRTRRGRRRATLGAAREAIAADLARLDGRLRRTSSSGWAGRSRTSRRVKHELAAYDPSVIQGATLEARRGRPADRALPHAYRRRAAQHRWPPAETRGGDPGRRLIVRTVLAELGRDRLTVSDRGLRHGVLAERFGR